MKSALWAIAGIVAGFVAAHQINKTPQGRQFFEDVENKAKGFGSAIMDGYKSREAELRSAIVDAAETAEDLR